MPQYILCDRKEELVREWRKIFFGYDKVEVKLGGFFETRCQVVVSPTNSFGEMRGGLDYYLSIFFDKNTSELCKEFGVGLKEVLNDYSIAKKLYQKLEWTIERKVKEKIRKEFGGELPVGRAVLVETGNKQLPYLLSAPTMRLHGDISKTDNVYWAMKAILEIEEKEGLGTILIPGLGTGTGRMSVKDCAEQMGRAFAERYGK